MKINRILAFAILLAVFSVSGFSAEELCGNGQIESGEQCDGAISSETCESLGYYGGEISCTNCIIDTSRCLDEVEVESVNSENKLEGVLKYWKVIIGAIVVVVVLVAIIELVRKIHYDKESRNIINKIKEESESERNKIISELRNRGYSYEEIKKRLGE